jgi:hypothetical protein
MLPFISTMSQAAIIKDDDVVMGDPEDESSNVETNDARDCADCGEDIGNYQPFVEFMPCRHVVCCPCQLTTLTDLQRFALQLLVDDNELKNCTKFRKEDIRK